MVLDFCLEISFSLALILCSCCDLYMQVLQAAFEMFIYPQAYRMSKLFFTHRETVGLRNAFFSCVTAWHFEMIFPLKFS